MKDIGYFIWIAFIALLFAAGPLLIIRGTGDHDWLTVGVGLVWTVAMAGLGGKAIQALKTAGEE